MSLKTKALQILSYFTNSPIQLGYGLSIDNNLNISKDTVLHTLESKNTVQGVYYVLKDIEGPFEFVGFIRNENINLYQLKHKETGETFNITKTMLEFLFEKK